MLVAPEATAHPTILLSKCKPKASATRTHPTLRNPGPRKQSRPTAKPLLHPAPSLPRPERPPAQIKKESFLRKRRKSGTEKTISREMGITPTTLRLVKRRNKTTKATRNAITARRRAIFSRNCPEPPKNLCRSWQPPSQKLMIARRL